MTVILLRHGRSTSNTAHTLAGRSDGVDLDDKGLDQAQTVVDRDRRAAGPRDCALTAAAVRAHGGTAGRCARSAPGGRRAHLEVDYGSWTGRKIGDWSRNRCGRWCSSSQARPCSPR